MGEYIWDRFHFKSKIMWQLISSVIIVIIFIFVSYGLGIKLGFDAAIKYIQTVGAFIAIFITILLAVPGIINIIESNKKAEVTNFSKFKYATMKYLYGENLLFPLNQSREELKERHKETLELLEAQATNPILTGNKEQYAKWKNAFGMLMLYKDINDDSNQDEIRLARWSEIHGVIFNVFLALSIKYDKDMKIDDQSKRPCNI